MGGARSEPANCGRGIFCVRCGYDLRETPLAGVCPECRELCEASLWIRSDAGQRWRRRMRYGALLLAAAAGTRASFDVVPWLMFRLGYRFTYYSPTHFWLSLEWWLFPLSVGALLISSCFGPDRGRLRWAFPFRIAARWIVPIWAIEEIALPIMRRVITHNPVEGARGGLHLPPGWIGLFEISQAVYWPMWMIALVGLLGHLFIIAARLRTRGLLIQLRAVAIALAFWSIVAYNIDWFESTFRRWGLLLFWRAINSIDDFVHYSTWWIELSLELWSVVLMLWLARKYSTPLPDQPRSSIGG